MYAFYSDVSFRLDDHSSSVAWSFLWSDLTFLSLFSALDCLLHGYDYYILYSFNVHSFKCTNNEFLLKAWLFKYPIKY